MSTQLTIWGTLLPDGTTYSPYAICPCGSKGGYSGDVLLDVFVPWSCPACGTEFTRGECKRAYKRTARAKLTEVVDWPKAPALTAEPYTPSIAWSNFPNATPIKNFQAVQQAFHAKASDAPPPLTFAGLAELVADLDRRFPRPTDDQLAWARKHGFPGWPGFKFGPRAIRAFRASTSPRVDTVQGDHLTTFNGMPFVVDPDIDPNAVLSAEAEWKKENP